MPDHGTLRLAKSRRTIWYHDHYLARNMPTTWHITIV